MTVSAAATCEIEPLVRLSDLDEYREGLAHRLDGRWDEEKWTAFRVRFGVYGQKQSGVQMVRIKIPGGVVPLPWLSVLGEFNREFCRGDAHITTRQDFQTYFVPLERSAEALEFLYSNGLTTREACGNTLRNINACSLAGNCPREHVDAGLVASRLARSWIRHPLVQHMPRKVKISVSGCATDCGVSAIHDLSFVATERDGGKGFVVYAGGGLGGQPRPAVKVLDFVVEEDLQAVVETLARLHQRYSDRINRNAARIKFVVKRFGEEKFRALFQEEFERLRLLPQRPWQPLVWRKPGEAAVERTPLGVVKQHDGRFAVVGNPPLGLLSSDQFDALAALGRDIAIGHVRVTRDQNVVIPDVPADRLAEVVRRLQAINIDVPSSAADSADVVSCPGTTTCRIGITNSQGFGREIWAESQNDPTAKGISVRVSGCQNSCGLHEIGDFGFQGLAKKIDGVPAPHYQIHIGGDGRTGVQPGVVGLHGPIVAARHGLQALRLLRQGFASGRQAGESVRTWAERLGKDGLNALLAPLAEADADGKLFIDWGDVETFKGAPTLRGECAAPFASDDLLADLADDALIRLDRHLLVGQWDDALRSAEQAVVFSARRLLHLAGQFTKDDEAATVIIDRTRAVAPARAQAALEHVEALRTAALSSGRAEAYRQSVTVFLDTVRAITEAAGEKQDAAE
ncbi:nitrite/sulfite reductase [Telmatospirillum sp.]|uniref:nitrite/sulfite reductase n=1 Tax=Telmatospirillum sp. TaxID=2079197 RepID=UPI0028417C57|nr:nitrite/sulfite reductase [Telmatospirillum sp.]MDR3438238.1 nitrite/sulfite reductase [Telmatospirillum sp.]